jgi:Secretion system C-terminal sorting domain
MSKLLLQYYNPFNFPMGISKPLKPSFLALCLLLCTAPLTLINGQCPATSCATHTSIVSTSTLLPCGSGGTQIDGNINNNSDCGDSNGDNCWKFVITRHAPTIAGITTKIGKGSGCNGEVNTFYYLINGVCTTVPTYSPQNRFTFDFAADGVINIWLCDNSSGQVSLCDLCAEPVVPVPVELVDFSAKQTDEKITVEWATASEENNDYFEVQHSTNGRDFIPIAIERGHGTTTELQHYKVIHSKPERGDNYYRLKQVDFDGTFEIFDIVVVKVQGDNPIFNVYPSEVFDVITLETPDFSPKDTEVSIHNANGLLMRKSILKEGAYKVSIDVSDLPAGLYFIRFINENYDYTAKQFVKMRD